MKSVGKKQEEAWSIASILSLPRIESRILPGFKAIGVAARAAPGVTLREPIPKPLTQPHSPKQVSKRASIDCSGSAEPASSDISERRWRSFLFFISRRLDAPCLIEQK